MFQCAQGQQINCAPYFSISTCINFHLKNQKKKRLTTCQHHKRCTKIFHLLVCNQKRFAKKLFSTNFAPRKAVAPQGHGLIGLRHKVALLAATYSWLTWTCLCLNYHSKTILARCTSTKMFKRLSSDLLKYVKRWNALRRREKRKNVLRLKVFCFS